MTVYQVHTTYTDGRWITEDFHTLNSLAQHVYELTALVGTTVKVFAVYIKP